MAQKGTPCTKCGKAEPEVEFYDYTATGGARLPECKGCRRRRTRSHQAAVRREDVKSVMTYLRRCSRRTRHARVHDMIRKGEMSVEQFRAVLESGEIQPPNNYQI